APHRQPGDQLAGYRARPPERRVRLARGRLHARAANRGPRDERLEAAAVRAVTGTGWAVEVDGHVAELGAGAACPADEPPVHRYPTADPGPDGEHHDVPGTQRRARSQLPEGRQVGVVVDVDGKPQPLGHEVPKRHAVEREV